MLQESNKTMYRLLSIINEIEFLNYNVYCILFGAVIPYLISPH